MHLEVHRFVKQGYHIVLIGHAGHDEVIGTMGQAPGHITLVENESQARTVALPPEASSPKPQAPSLKLMVLTQTTLGVDDTAGVLAVLRERFPALELPPTDDICYATQNRQDAVKAMSAGGMELLLVVGSRNSSNAARLVEVAVARGVRGHLIDSADEIRSEWLEGTKSIGVTAGASTPESVVQAVLDRLRDLGAGDVRLCTTAEESTTFQLPVLLKKALSLKP